MSKEHSAQHNINYWDSEETHTPLTGHQENTQSRFYTLYYPLNPLIGAAGPLLTLHARLKTNELSDVARLHSLLVNEVKAFENHALKAGYRPQVVLAARYIIASLIDQSLKTHEQPHSPTSLVITFHQEDFDYQKLLLILKRALAEPEQYLDLLELGYLCLNLGFESNLHPELQQILDQIYQVIMKYDPPTKRLHTEDPNAQLQTKQRHFWWPPIWLTVLLGFLILCGIYIPYSKQLKQLNIPIHQLLEKIQNSMSSQ